MAGRDDPAALLGRSEMDVALRQEPSCAFWQDAAAVLVRQGELECWKAFTAQWLACRDVEQQIADTLSG